MGIDMKSKSWVELKDIKQWIDGASYEELSTAWDKLPKDSPILNPQYAVSVYFVKSMKQKRNATFNALDTAG